MNRPYQVIIEPPMRANGRREPEWDRMNFGQVLRSLRLQAGLTQVELAERIERDRRRVIVLEQGRALRLPQQGEIALLAAALGGGDAEAQLKEAVGKTALPARDKAPMREQLGAQMAGDLNGLLRRIDDLARRSVSWPTGRRSASTTS